MVHVGGSEGGARAYAWNGKPEHTEPLLGKEEFYFALVSLSF